jgi:3-hydroxypropanoate dehydrogenase
MPDELEECAQDQLFREARTRNGWTERPVSYEQLRELYDLIKFGPTSANCCPARFVWVKSDDGKRRLSDLGSPNNAPKVLAAPGTVIVGYDLDFADQMPRLFPARAELMQQYLADPAVAEVTAFRNGSLQGAYLVMAPRTLGLGCGPMSGFDNDGVDQAFFAGARIRSSFICSLGYGSDQNLVPRNPRLSFEDTGPLPEAHAVAPRPPTGG